MAQFKIGDKVIAKTGKVYTIGSIKKREGKKYYFDTEKKEGYKAEDLTNFYTQKKETPKKVKKNSTSTATETLTKTTPASQEKHSATSNE